MTGNKVYLFWGGMDLIYIGRFCYLNVSQGKVPLYSDVQSFVRLSSEQDSISFLIFSMSLVLNVSIIVSMFLFLRRSRFASCLAYAQAPLRLVFGVPSLSILVWASTTAGVTSSALLMGLLLFSEVLKVVSIGFWRTNHQII
ncbi:hypothetical protein QLG10_07730 [Pseudomonas sp. V98_8]|jgi:hypothetical protein|uniref:hypothetical protein n=1 Tax=Pseudomonas sp. V98_8 TaxID=3044228 RepID=UPI00249F2677|nr:hypothetical protein [Pseudomonas sp. V98_8]MDI3392327.1 hypothetical protein [Pseudomonas sp. V98_8]